MSRSVKKKLGSNFEDCRNKLLSRYSSKKKGIWLVYGESPNCDFGGFHGEPFLGVFSGEYGKVVDYVLNKLTSSFFSWGAGGSIVWEKIKEIK